MHLIDELADLLDAEDQLTEALPKMAAAAAAPALRTAFQKHLKETRGHMVRLNQAIRQLGEKPRKKTCEAMEGLISEGNHLMGEAPEGALRDVVMITSAQKVEHYEMASYGTARTYAQVLGKSAVARLLEQTLKEEKAADAKLTSIAEASVNEEAAEAWMNQDTEQGVVGRSTAWVGEAIDAATRQLAGGARRAAASVGLAAEAGKKRRSSTTQRSASKTSKRKSGSRGRSGRGSHR